MNKKEFKELDREQMIIAFNQLKDDYSVLFNELDKEKEKNKKLRIQISAREQVCEDLQKQLNGAFDRGFISKDKLKRFFQDKIIYRQFELQQEYKDFKDDVRLNTLQDIKEEILGD